MRAVRKQYGMGGSKFTSIVKEGLKLAKPFASHAVDSAVEGVQNLRENLREKTGVGSKRTDHSIQTMGMPQNMLHGSGAKVKKVTMKNGAFKFVRSK